MTFRIGFNNVNAISADLSEPDEISIKFTIPGLFLDAETGEPLSDMSWETVIKISP